MVVEGQWSVYGRAIAGHCAAVPRRCDHTERERVGERGEVGRVTHEGRGGSGSVAEQHSSVPVPDDGGGEIDRARLPSRTRTCARAGTTKEVYLSWLLRFLTLASAAGEQQLRNVQ